MVSPHSWERSRHVQYQKIRQVTDRLISGYSLRNKCMLIKPCLGSVKKLLLILWADARDEHTQWSCVKRYTLLLYMLQEDDQENLASPHNNSMIFNRTWWYGKKNWDDLMVDKSCSSMWIYSQNVCYSKHVGVPCNWGCIDIFLGHLKLNLPL